MQQGPQQLSAVLHDAHSNAAAAAAAICSRTAVVLHLAYHCSIEGAPKRACVRRYVGARSAWRPLGCLGLSQGAATHLGLQLAGSTPVLSFYYYYIICSLSLVNH